MQRGSGPGARDICLGDAQRGLPLAHAVAQLQPGAESGGPGRLGLLHGDQQLVGEAVGVEVPASSEPLLPALAGSQLLHRPCGERAVGAPALGALLVAQGATGLGQRTSPWFGVPRGAGPIPAGAARAACEPWRGQPARPGAGASFRRPGGRRPRRLRPSPRPAAWVRCRPLRSRGLAALRLRGLFVARVSALNRPLQSAQRDA